MPELGPYGSVRGARGNSRPYRESSWPTTEMTRLTQLGQSSAWICPKNYLGLGWTSGGGILVEGPWISFKMLKLSGKSERPAWIGHSTRR